MQHIGPIAAKVIADAWTEEKKRRQRRASIDTECYNLARHFLQDEKPDIDREWQLAEEIQRTVEDFFR